MVVFPRREINRIRTGNILGMLLGLVVLAGVVLRFRATGEFGQFGLILIGLVALATIAIALLQLFSDRGTSKVILFHTDAETIIATNHLHDGFKLRFLRDLLNDDIVPFSDKEREEWSELTKQGFHTVFKVQNVRKTFLFPLLFLTFDEVFVLDHLNRWDYFDCRNTSEPATSARGVGPLNDESVLPEGRRQPAT